ncbi:hypothetical protein [Kitasatospora sp. NPDC004531]
MEQSGRTAQHTAEAVPGETGGILAASDGAESSLRGWRTGIELNSCTDEWKRLLDNLSREMDSQGDKLIRTAANYRKGDQNSVREMTAVDVPAVPAGTGIGRPGPAPSRPFDQPRPVVGAPYPATPEQIERFRTAFDTPPPTMGPHLLPPDQAEQARRLLDPAAQARPGTLGRDL